MITDEIKTFLKNKLCKENRHYICAITGANGSGKTRTIENIKKWSKELNSDFIILDTDSHSHLSQEKLGEFAQDLKEKAKEKPVYIATLRDEILKIADLVINIEKIIKLK